MGITEEFIATSPSGTVYMTMSLQRLLNFFPGVRHSFLANGINRKIYREPVDIEKITEIIPSSGEGKWTAKEVLRLKVNVPIITQPLMMRFVSEDCDKISEKLVPLLHNQFGGNAFVKDE